MIDNFGVSCEGGKICTLHNLFCTYPKCEKGRKDKFEEERAIAVIPLEDFSKKEDK